MNITLYNFTKRKNSTKQPGTGTSISAVLKDNCSNISPIFTVQSNPTGYTYMYAFGRYYYIEEIIYTANNLWEIHGTIDPMATWKSEILSTTGYVLYSASNYNSMIVDPRMSSVATATIKSSSGQLFSFLSSTMAYVLTYVASKPNLGGSGVVVCSQSVLENICEIVNGTGYINHISETLKSLMGVYDSLISCIALPYTPSASSTWEIFLAGYDTGQVGATPTKYNTYQCDLTIPWQFSDFRNLPPFTSMILEIPTVGTVNLNPADFIGQSSIHLKAVCDNITGDVVVYVGNGIAKVTSNIATKIAIGTAQSNSAGVVGGLISAGAQLLSGRQGVGGALSDAFGAVTASIERNVGVIGSNGSYISSVPGTGGSGVARLYTICHNTNVEPSNMASTVGRPCKQSLSIGSLSGYVQTVDFNVNGSMPSNMKDEINSMMNGGAFIE